MFSRRNRLEIYKLDLNILLSSKSYAYCVNVIILHGNFQTEEFSY